MAIMKPPLTCEKCFEIKGELFDPDHCDICWPTLMPENYDAYQVYCVCQNQLIMGFIGPVAISHLAVWKIIDEYEIQDRIGTFEKVIAVSAAVLAVRRKYDDESSG